MERAAKRVAANPLGLPTGGFAWAGAVFLVVIMVAFLSACRKPHPTLTVISEPPYAGATLEKMLVAENTGDYDQYAQYLDPQLPDPSKLFDTQVASVKQLFGDYILGSLRFSDASFQYDNAHEMGFTVVYYYGEFTKDPAHEVLLHIAFREVGGKRYVEDVGFNTRPTYY